jgi:hypothetical protein
LQTEYSLYRVLINELELAKRLEETKEELAGRPDYSPQALFNTFTEHPTNILTAGVLKGFLRRHGLLLNDNEIDGLLRRVGGATGISQDVFE